MEERSSIMRTFGSSIRISDGVSMKTKFYSEELPKILNARSFIIIIITKEEA
jgi:hypothetical protein